MTSRLEASQLAGQVLDRSTYNRSGSVVINVGDVTIGSIGRAEHVRPLLRGERVRFQAPSFELQVLHIGVGNISADFTPQNAGLLVLWHRDGADRHQQQPTGSGFVKGAEQPVSRATARRKSLAGPLRQTSPC
jgi:hypothetical protein